MANILYRVGVVDILENAQKVCTTWRNICKDPSMWRVIYMDNISNHDNRNGRSHMQMRVMCKHVVDQSQGQPVDITICDFANDNLIQYIANRLSQLRRLEFAFFYATKAHHNWAKFLKKFPLLEELSLYVTNISPKVIVTAGRFCPMLTTLKLNHDLGGHHGDLIAIAIGKYLPKLKHLELIGHFMSNTGLQAILDG